MVGIDHEKPDEWPGLMPKPVTDRDKIIAYLLTQGKASAKMVADAVGMDYFTATRHLKTAEFVVLPRENREIMYAVKGGEHGE